MRVLALLPVHEPPAYLAALAAAGHDIHLVATRPGAVPQPYVDGVAVYTLGFWHKAMQGARPHVALSELGDKQALDIVRKARDLPHMQIPAGAPRDPLDLEAALYATIPPGAARMQAQLKPQPNPLDGHETRVVFWAHFSVPYRRAGSEVMAHAMLRALHDKGMGVLVITSEMPEAPDAWEVDGIPHVHLPYASAEILIRRVHPQVVVTHHHLSPRAIAVGKAVGARTVLVKHNDHEAQARFLWSGPDLVVYNTDYVRESLRADWLEVDRIPSMIVHPPVDPAEHHVEKTGDAVTLVNLSANKGVHTFRGVAELLPDLPFLGVVGAHGVQETHPMPDNVTVLPHTSNMRDDVWARTRVLLMPSVYESYGMAGVEALASGLPVIAHPTPGLREALGDAGTFIDRDDHQAWADAVRALYRGGKRRGNAMRAARERSAWLTDRTEGELKQWVDAVRELAAR